MLQLLEQLQKQAKEMPSLIRISPQELATLRDELFELTIEQSIEGTSLSNEELQKEVLNQLIAYLADVKRFPLKSNLRHFAEQWGTSGLNANHTKAHIIGTLMLKVKDLDRTSLEHLLQVMQGNDSVHQEKRNNVIQDTNEAAEFSWFDYMESVKK